MAPRILVVDDELSLRLTLLANLEVEGFDVVGAADAAEALAVLRAGQPFDVVLSDIRMPGMTGTELFRQIKLLRPDLPVILMTGFALEKEVQDAITNGAFAVLSKPFDVDRAKPLLLNASRCPAVLVLVEGMLGSAATMAQGMTVLGVRAQGVNDVRSALTVLKKGEVDVCVVDLGAPGASVAATLEEIRTAHPGLVIVGIAAAGATDLLGRTKSRANAFVQRPLKIRDLIGVIAKARAGSSARLT